MRLMRSTGILLFYSMARGFYSSVAGNSLKAIVLPARAERPILVS